VTGKAPCVSKIVAFIVKNINTRSSTRRWEQWRCRVMGRLFLVSFSSTFYARVFRTKVFSLRRVWLRTNFHTKNAWVKCWWNWHLFDHPRHLCCRICLHLLLPRPRKPIITLRSNKFTTFSKVCIFVYCKIAKIKKLFRELIDVQTNVFVNHKLRGEKGQIYCDYQIYISIRAWETKNIKNCIPGYSRGCLDQCFLYHRDLKAT